VRLPVDPDRLRAQFPGLTDDDLEAYAAVTRRILAAPSAEERARVTHEVLSLARQAREGGLGSSLSPEQQMAVRYLAAVEKMQRGPTH
jgi:hypothetical protein